MSGNQQQQFQKQNLDVPAGGNVSAEILYPIAWGGRQDYPYPYDVWLADESPSPETHFSTSTYIPFLYYIDQIFPGLWSR